MKYIKCKIIPTFFNYQKPSSVLIFGRTAKIRYFVPDYYIMQCIAIDENGNKYAIYTDYDACIVSSDAIAVPIKKEC